MMPTKEELETISKLDRRQPYVWLATWFGFGFFRPAPGTWGSLGSIPLGIMLFLLLGTKGFAASIFIVIALGFWSAKHFDAATGGHDNKMIVIDEAAGQWISMLPVLHYLNVSALFVMLAFILFRFFDILKPWPISWCDKNLKGAAGVMIDDILAGLAAAAILTGVIHYAGFS